MNKTYAVTIRLANGQYVTIRVTATNSTAAASVAKGMGGEVAGIRQLD